MDVAEPLALKGRFTLEIHNPDGSVADRREFDNLLCVNGLTLLAYAINWSGIAAQNADMGSPFPSTIFGPIYGAIGTGLTAPADTDTGLTTEVDRAEVSGAAVSPAAPGSASSFTWQFFFGLPLALRTLTECGVFGQALDGTGSGAILDHALISPAVVQDITQTATLSVTFSFISSGGAAPLRISTRQATLGPLAPSATAGVYGSAVTFAPVSPYGVIAGGIEITANVTIASADIVTVRATATYSDASTAVAHLDADTTGLWSFTPDELFKLYAHENNTSTQAIVSIALDMTSSVNSSTSAATITADAIQAA